MGCNLNSTPALQSLALLKSLQWRLNVQTVASESEQKYPARRGSALGMLAPVSILPAPPLIHQFTSRGHQAGFTTGQQKHVIASRTPYLGAYVGGNQVHVPVISIIHHKLCKGAIDAQNDQEPQIKHTYQKTNELLFCKLILRSLSKWPGLPVT